ncbi:hypothetical protein MLP_48700 [Microlunatus phosphovorus NM-1]|uniref:Uncharacterized protein n=1 Tax=Microlunatus phosphovorus (strain ATCC 700054 / DSM 10555 / JCM 9379 / NBRC 101784 / NCIMB 13414 / VKM Ac-1990 / NM-1) TaxID=1032480 RepID=F5XFV0_MICPN|nr:hypothetical protein MLP_48700 [Microlunatus phosphovorus NM-1]
MLTIHCLIRPAGIFKDVHDVVDVLGRYVGWPCCSAWRTGLTGDSYQRRSQARPAPDQHRLPDQNRKNDIMQVGEWRSRLTRASSPE